MHPMIKKVILSLVPPLQRIIEQRDHLLRQVKADWSMQSSEHTHHRMYTTLNVVPALSVGSSGDDTRIVERLLKSYQGASSDQYGSDSIWREIFNLHHKHFHEIFMRGDVEKARQILANPNKSNIFYGFDELCAIFAPNWQNDPKSLASNCQDNLLRLAEAMGALWLENPETGVAPSLTNAEMSTDQILRAMEAILEVEISFPDIFPDAVGAGSSRGIVTYRAVQALYLAFRLRRIFQDDHDPYTSNSICEIGAGLGRSALFASQLGLKNYTIVDIPMTAISQGYYLMRCLGEDAVALAGEPRRVQDQIKLMYPEEFFSSAEHFDLVVNVDSLTELGHDLGTRYLKKISTITPKFLSINHEANSIRVIDLLKELDRPYKISRYPYWMRQGYVEEIFKFQS